jgi:OHCU decarboxylase
MRLDELNMADRATFVGAVGWVFEHSPWVAERAWSRRPFRTVGDLAETMAGVMHEGSRSEQLALLRAHPDLGTRASMSETSTSEQAAAGLDRLSPADFDRLTDLNQRYRQRFGYPFLLAVKGATATQVIEALTRRVSASPDVEWSEALQQVARIARNRLDEAVQ